MKIELDTSKPWLTELNKIKNELIEIALKDANGNQAAAARTLGTCARTLRNQIKRSPVLRDIVDNKTIEPEIKCISNDIITQFLLGQTIDELSNKFNKGQTSIMDILSEKLTGKVCKVILNHNQRNRKMFNPDKILETHRRILAEIAEKVRDNRGNELSEEHMVYAKILFNNGFMTEKGVITEEGKDALYH